MQALHDDQIALLLSAWIRRELMRVSSSGYAPRLDDYALKLRVNGKYDPQHLKHVIERAARLAEGIALQRAKLPPSVLESDVERAFSPVARRLGGPFDRGHLALHVSDANGALEAWVEHVRGSEWSTRFELSLQRRLVPKLCLGDSRHASLWARWREPDVSVGDVAFDAAFIVREERDDLARAVLTPAVMSAWLELGTRLRMVQLEEGRISGRVDRADRRESAGSSGAGAVGRG